MMITEKQKELLAGVTGLQVYERMAELYHYHATEKIEGFAQLLEQREKDKGYDTRISERL